MKQASVSSIDQGGGNLHRRENNICVIELCGVPEPPTSKKRRLAVQTVASLVSFKALIRRLTIGAVMHANNDSLGEGRPS